MPLFARPAVPVVPDPVAHRAWGEWYEAYGAVVYSYLRFQLPSADLAEDLTAEVFLRAGRAAHRFEAAKGSPRGWLLRIAHNALRDHYRQARRRPQVSLASLRDLRHDAPSPEERLLWEEEVAALLAAVGRLPRGDRDIVGLRYGSGLSVAEIGLVLGLRDAVVRTRLWRALGRLRKALQP